MKDWLNKSGFISTILQLLPCLLSKGSCLSLSSFRHSLPAKTCGAFQFDERRFPQPRSPPRESDVSGQVFVALASALCVPHQLPLRPPSSPVVPLKFYCKGFSSVTSSPHLGTLWELVANTNDLGRAIKSRAHLRAQRWPCSRSWSAPRRVLAPTRLQAQE